MVPLITDKMYEQLLAVQQRMIDEEIGSPANVFVPVGTALQRATPSDPRILYVGKATRAFDDGHTGSFSDSFAVSSNLASSCLARGYSAFWQMGRNIVTGIVEKARKPPKHVDPLDFFGWSNLAKIGDIDDNPDPSSLMMQSDLCVQSLRYEIAQFRPTATLFVTTNFAQDEILYPLLGRDDWNWDTPQGNRVAFKLHPHFGLVIWTNHPQGMRPKGTRAIVQSFVIDLVFNHMTGRPLPPSA